MTNRTDRPEPRDTSGRVETFDLEIGCSPMGRDTCTMESTEWPDENSWIGYSDFVEAMCDADSLHDQALWLVGAVMKERDEARRERDALAARLKQYEWCMCGESVDSHSITSNHAPVSEYEHAMKLLQTANETNRKLADRLESVRSVARPIVGIRNGRAPVMSQGEVRGWNNAMRAVRGVLVDTGPGDGAEEENK